MGCGILGSTVHTGYIFFDFYLRSHANLGSKGFDSKSMYLLFLLFSPLSTDLESDLVGINNISEDFSNCFSEQARHNYKSGENWLFLHSISGNGWQYQKNSPTFPWLPLPYSVLASPQKAKADLRYITNLLEKVLF